MDLASPKRRLKGGVSFFYAFFGEFREILQTPPYVLC